MAINNQQINVSELDFDQIKTNLKEYLQGQDEFSDYDFEGSALSILLDILAYNTHYNNLYNNMTINELFLDSATKRSSVVSRANELGYVPVSAVCSRALINLTVTNISTPVPPASIVLPKYTPFTSTVNGVTYTFYTTEDLTAVNSGGAYVFNNVVIKEGTPLTYKYTVADGVRYVIPNANVDTSTLKVRVQDSSSSTNFVSFNQSDTILNITSEDNVYYIKEIDNGLFEISFGDGVLGKQLSNGNVVHLEYLVTKMSEPNGCRSFIYNGGSLSGGTVTLSLVNPAYNGSEPESIDSIKYYAPKSYTTQNRAITAEDYKTLIFSLFPEARAVSVWGGENNDPPQYGKVFMTIIPQTNRNLTSAEKSYVIDEILSPRKTLTVTPEIVDPVYARIELNVAFYYNPQLTTRSAGDLSALVHQTINTYNQDYLSTFGSVFKYSKLASMIDASEQSITSNITTIKIHREITPLFNVASPYEFNIGNPIYNSGVPEESIITTGFYITASDEMCFIDDLPVEDNDIGSLRLFYYNSKGEKVILSNIGTVNYSTGLISINTLNVTAINGDIWDVIIKPQSNDVVSVRNHFAQIDETLLSISAIVDTPTKAYTFTSSRN